MKENDGKDFEYADTTFARDIESRVFQSIAIRCLSEIEGIALLEGNIFDDLLGREGQDRVKGIHVEQDQKNHSVSLKVEINVAYGLSLPDKADEIQSKIASEVVRLTGLHVNSVHVVFKNILHEAAELVEES